MMMNDDEGGSGGSLKLIWHLEGFFAWRKPCQCDLSGAVDENPHYTLRSIDKLPTSQH